MKGNEGLIEKFIDDPTHITVDDCEKLLISQGFKPREKGGSHIVYHKKGDYPIIVVIPKKSKYVKPGYVRNIVRRLKLEG